MNNRKKSKIFTKNELLRRIRALESYFLRKKMIRMPKGKVIFAFCALLSLFLGAIGYKELFPEITIFSSIYLSMGLFFMDTNHMKLEFVPWTLETARWLSAILTVTSVVTAAWYFLRSSIQRSLLSGHDVVFGEGSAVENLLNQTKSKKIIPSLVLLSTNALLTKKWRSQGGLAIEIAGKGGALQAKHLEEACIGKASNLFLLDVNDQANLRGAFLAKSMILSGKIKIVVRQDAAPTRDLIQRNGLLLPGGEGDLSIISIETSRARLMLKENPLEWEPVSGLVKDVYLALPHLSTFEEAVAVQAALCGHYAHGKKVNLWLSSEQCRTRLVKNYPYISQCLHLYVLGDEGVNSFDELLTYASLGSQVTILTSDESPESGFVAGLRYRERCPAHIHLKVILSAPLALKAPQLEKSMKETDRQWVGHAPSPSRLSLFDDHLDTVAQQIHKTWYDGNTQRIKKALSEGKEKEAEALRCKPTYKPWSQLTEHQKDNNRTVSDHMEIKIRAVGLSPSQSDLLKAWAKLTPQQIDMLSRMEHERWMAPLLLNGYQAGERDESAKTHPDLIPYDDLDQSTKDYDKEQVLMVAHYYALG